MMEIFSRVFFDYSHFRLLPGRDPEHNPCVLVAGVLQQEGAKPADGILHDIGGHDPMELWNISCKLPGRRLNYMV